MTVNRPIIDTAFIEKLIEKNGPDPEDYKTLLEWYNSADQQRKKKEVTTEELSNLREIFGSVLNTSKTLQGMALCIPHGYHGDYEIIDKIYTNHVSQIAKNEKWDHFYHSQSAPQAVRNRKTYFKNLLKSKANKPLRVLNLASGPCRDILEFFEENPEANVQFDCIELDENAIKYASELLGEHLPKVNFIHKNIFKFRTESTYDLVWSAGLFDYFDDRTFVRILSRFLENIAPDGELVIGNFHPRNPTRAYMEFGDWFLHHRTEMELVDLAVEAGVADYSRIRVEQEALGVNLFMRVEGRER